MNIGAIKYYLIHGGDPERKEFMCRQFELYGICLENVYWILKPNAADIHTLHPIKKVCINGDLTRGMISCTYKHYLALKMIADDCNTLSDFAVIMEDNIEFLENVPQKIANYVEQMPADWDCLFDSDIANLKYIEGDVTNDRIVYKKSRENTRQCHGGSRGANFILVRKSAARLMADSFLPFDNVSDLYYNTLIRRHNLNVYWSEPPNVHKIARPSTCFTRF